MCFALCDLSNTAQPLGRAVDPWVHWHEMGGHGTLGDHVGGGTFGFCHSAGDGLAALQMDPESALRALPERFRYAPFRPFTTERRFDRPAPAWAWGSANDDGAYGSRADPRDLPLPDLPVDRRRPRRPRPAQVRVARRDLPDPARDRRPDARDEPQQLEPGDLVERARPRRGAVVRAPPGHRPQNWVSEGSPAAPTTRSSGGRSRSRAPTAASPPAVDVYIDDGRQGEYPFQPVHWHNTSMWNRNAPDGLPGHQNAIAGARTTCT